jgi:hypothetical protein
MLNHTPEPYWGVTKTYASWQVGQLLACSEGGIGTWKSQEEAAISRRFNALHRRNALVI